MSPSISLQLGLRSEVLGSRPIQLTAANRRGFEKSTNRIDPAGYKLWRAHSIRCGKRDLDDFPGRSYPEYGSLVTLGDSILWHCQRKKDLGVSPVRPQTDTGSSLVALYSTASVANSVADVFQSRRPLISLYTTIDAQPGLQHPQHSPVPA